MKTTIFTIPKLDKSFAENDMLVVTAVTDNTMELRYFGNAYREPPPPPSRWSRFKGWLREINPKGDGPFVMPIKKYPD